MNKKRFPKSIKIYIPLIILFVLLVVFMPRVPKFAYDYRKGNTWMYENLVAEFDFPILKTEAQLQEEYKNVSKNVVPFYNVDDKIAFESQLKLQAMDFGPYAYIKPEISDILTDIYDNLVLSDTVSVVGTSSDMVVQVEQAGITELKIADDIYTETEAVSVLMEQVSKLSMGTDMAQSLAQKGLAKLIQPNLKYNQVLTELAVSENLQHISPTMGLLRAGEQIIANGDVINARTEQLLDSYKAEYYKVMGGEELVWTQWVGHICIALLLVFALLMVIYYSDAAIFSKFNKYLYVCTIVAIAFITSCILADTRPELFYMAPFTLIALYLLAFFKKSLVYSVYSVALLPILIFAPSGLELYVMYYFAGLVCIEMYGYFNKGWLQFVTALVMFVVMTLVWCTFGLINGSDALSETSVILLMFFSAFLCVAGYPLVYLFEKIFMLVSNTRLVDLSDTSNSLLRLLADKAPGTFHHSLQVMNLSDAAARALGANIPLVRAAALYHDVGKINNPQCFIENETQGVKFHENLNPKESAQYIIRHVSDGVALAEKHNIPGILIDFIRTHHGTTFTAYFYKKYLEEGGSSEDASAFYYDGVKPVTKEQVILMLCDSIEAASRTLKDYSQESVNALVDNIVEGKISAGQLSDAEISLQELGILKSVVKSHLIKMYHSRIVYPKLKVKK